MDLLRQQKAEAEAAAAAAADASVLDESYWCAVSRSGGAKLMAD